MNGWEISEAVTAILSGDEDKRKKDFAIFLLSTPEVFHETDMDYRFILCECGFGRFVEQSVLMNVLRNDSLRIGPKPMKGGLLDYCELSKEELCDLILHITRQESESRPTYFIRNISIDVLNRLGVEGINKIFLSRNPLIGMSPNLFCALARNRDLVSNRMREHLLSKKIEEDIIPLFVSCDVSFIELVLKGMLDLQHFKERFWKRDEKMMREAVLHHSKEKWKRAWHEFYPKDIRSQVETSILSLKTVLKSKDLIYFIIEKIPLREARPPSDVDVVLGTLCEMLWMKKSNELTSSH